MKILSPGNPRIMSLWSIPKASAQYRPIRTLVTCEADEGLIVHHTITGECVLLSPRESLSAI